MTSEMFMFGFIILVAFVGYRLRLLTRSGSLAASIVGLVIYISIGTDGLLLLGIFFASSSFWSRYRQQAKQMAEELHEKTSKRDYQQVFANGGLAAIFAAVYAYTNNTDALLAFSILIASANSDTWSSEIGTLSKSEPFSLRTLVFVERGTSGAVSLLGTGAGLLGSLLIACSAFILFDFTFPEMMVIFLLGFLGNVIDTVLGAYIQVLYQCEICYKITEKKSHCQVNTKLIRGYRFINNDIVNLVSAAVPACVVFIFY